MKLKDSKQVYFSTLFYQYYTISEGRIKLNQFYQKIENQVKKAILQKCKGDNIYSGQDVDEFIEWCDYLLIKAQDELQELNKTEITRKEKYRISQYA